MLVGGVGMSQALTAMMSTDATQFNGD